MPSKHVVFRLYAFLEGTNEYGITRNERWEIKEDESFESEEDAKDYICERSRQHTILPNVLQQWRETKEEHKTLKSEQEVVDDFCFNTQDRYYSDRRYFLGPPNLKKLNIKLKEKGIRTSWIGVQIINILDDR